MSESTATKPLNLKDTFSGNSYDEWKEAAVALLKGAPFEKKLITTTHEGFDLHPIYNYSDIDALPHLKDLPGTGSRVRHNHPSGYTTDPWLVSQELPYSTPKKFNDVARQEVDKGTTELNILLDVAAQKGNDPDTAHAGDVGACGLSLASLQDLDIALQGIDLEKISLYFRSGVSGLPVAALLLGLIEQRGLNSKKVRGCIESDPLGTLAWSGELPISLERAWKELALLTGAAHKQMPQVQTIAIQGLPYADGGGSMSQQLGYVLASAVETARRLEEHFINLPVFCRHLRFSFSLSGQFFIDLATLRAARLLWTRVVEALGGKAEEAKFHCHARTGLWNKTVLDPYVNMLRTTSEAFSAVLGGCDSLHVGPFDEIIRLPDDFSRRIARNTHIILREECELARVIDPAGGSWAVEKLTDDIASQAWAHFQEIEKAGGMSEALCAGLPQSRVKKVAEDKRKFLSQRRSILVGTNQYPNSTEKALDSEHPDYAAIQRERSLEVATYRTSLAASLDTEILMRLNSLLDTDDQHMLEEAVAAVRAGATLGEICRGLRANDREGATCEAIPQNRWAVEFEALRTASRAWKEEHGKAPQILQVNIGPSRRYRLRADWTAAFFQTGGFEVLGDEDFESPKAAVEALNASGASVAVLTSDDETYAAEVENYARAIKDVAPAATLIVAGAPGENEEKWKAAGVDDFVHVRVNNFELNKQMLTKLGVL
jgi:methylmalonyl-CoA mutase